jgi:mono/diheme cytochrome c family protein
LLAALAGILAVSCAFATGLGLQAVARRSSTQLPEDHEWNAPSPGSSTALIGAGRRIFEHNCAHCHGPDAHGDEGPDLHDLQVSNRYIARTVTRGIPHEMPSFAKKLTHDEVTELISFLRTLD